MILNSLYCIESTISKFVIEDCKNDKVDRRKRKTKEQDKNKLLVFWFCMTEQIKEGIFKYGTIDIIFFTEINFNSPITTSTSSSIHNLIITITNGLVINATDRSLHDTCIALKE